MAHLLQKLRHLAWRNRTRKIATLATILLTIGVVIFSAISPASAAVTVGTSTNSAATQYSQQRHTWYDGTRYWVAYMPDSSHINFSYSTDGITWAQDSAATLASAGGVTSFSVDADSNVAFLVTHETNGGSDYINAYSAASYPSNSFSWSASTNIANATSGTLSEPVIKRDTSNYVFVCYANSPFLTNVYCAKSTSTNNITAWGTSQLTGCGGNGFANVITALSNQSMIDVFADGSDANSCLYTQGVGWSAHSIPIASGSSPPASYGNSSSNEAYLSYINVSGNVLFRKYEAATGNASTKISSGLGAIPAGTGRNVVRDSSGNIYVAVNASGTCEIWKSTDNGSTFSEVDSAHHPSCASGTPITLAIDSSDNLHYAYFNSSDVVTYVKITSGLYGTVQTVGTTGFTNNRTGLNIAVDSNNAPHIVTSGATSTTSYLTYENDVTGTWSSELVIQSGTSGNQWKAADLTFNNSNIPEVSILYTISGAVPDYRQDAAIGNANNATAFTTQQIHTTGVGGSTESQQPMIIDASGNTWLTYADNATSPAVIKVLEHKSADTWATWQTAVTDSKQGSNPTMAIAGNMLYIMYVNTSGSLVEDVYNEDTTTWSGENTIQSGTTLANPHFRWALDADNQNKPLDFLYSDGTDVYYNQTGVWRAPVTLDSNAGNSSTTISRDDVTGNLYVSWIRGNTIYYKKGIGNFSSSEWDASPTSVYGTGTNTYLSATASANGGNIMPLVWTNGTASPYNVDYAGINLGHNNTPATPTLSTPSSGATGVSLTPSFTFKSSDAESDYLEYKISIYDSTCTNLIQSSDMTSPPQTGWSGQNQQSGAAYTGATTLAGSTTATYTYQGTLNSSTTYCWKAAAIDPGGSNTWSSYSGTQSFTTLNLPPAAPTLIKALSGDVGVTVTPQFQLYTTDAESNYVAYKIDICTDATCSSGSCVASPCSTGAYRTIDETTAQTGWSGQTANSGAAYTAGTTLSGSSVAYYKYAYLDLAPNRQYWWRAYAIDPGGSNSWSTASSINGFTTAPQETRILSGKIL